MKKQILIVALLLLTGLTGCDNTLKDHISIDDYEFYSFREYNREIEVPEGVDVIANLRDSKKIRGPIKGVVTNMRLVNKTKDGDTLEIRFYGKNYRTFSIDKDFYEAEKSIISK
ncbi:MAG: hypothetical protein J5637_07860 [Prevotella sp.]|nr:hypothetical protein [Prevotella sp.]